MLGWGLETWSRLEWAGVEVKCGLQGSVRMSSCRVATRRRSNSRGICCRAMYLYARIQSILSSLKYVNERDLSGSQLTSDTRALF